MANTFDIRFARSAGILGFLEAPTNSFRWKGSGTLRIDAAGISFAVRRGLLSFFPHRRRIAAASLEQVFREGHVLHLTFATPGIPRANLSCWAADADQAAEIVELLPTRRTIEVEHSPSRAAGPHYDRRALAILLALIAAVTGAAILLMPAREVAPPTAMPLEEAPLIAVEVNVAAPNLVLPADFVVAIPRESPHFAVASRQLTAFEKDAESLLIDYRIDRKLFESGALDTETFTHRLAALEFRWWNVTYRILEDGEFASLAMLDIRATLLAAARHWRAFLAGHAEGMRRGDHVMIAKSFDELAHAEELMSRARMYLR